MKGLFKSFFSSKNKDVAVRELNHPRDLLQGDIIKFGFMPQAELSNKQFQVATVNTYDFKDRHLTEFALSGDAVERIYLIVDESDDDAFLSLSRKVKRNLVEQLFDLDEFALLFDSEQDRELTRLQEPAELKNWTAAHYIQEVYAERGYFHKGDYRNKTLPQNEDDGENFDYYVAIDNSRQFVVEAEVYDGGETDVLITIRRPLRDIEEMWPKQQ